MRYQRSIILYDYNFTFLPHDYAHIICMYITLHKINHRIFVPRTMFQLNVVYSSTLAQRLFTQVQVFFFRSESRSPSGLCHLPSRNFLLFIHFFRIFFKDTYNVSKCCGSKQLPTFFFFFFYTHSLTHTFDVLNALHQLRDCSPPSAPQRTLPSSYSRTQRIL